MAILMQIFGRSLAALQQNSVFQQQQLAIAGQTGEAQSRLNIFGVDPMVLTKAANRLAAANLCATAPDLLALLQGAFTGSDQGAMTANAISRGKTAPPEIQGSQTASVDRLYGKSAQHPVAIRRNQRRDAGS